VLVGNHRPDQYDDNRQREQRRYRGGDGNQEEQNDRQPQAVAVDGVDVPVAERRTKKSSSGITRSPSRRMPVSRERWGWDELSMGAILASRPFTRTASNFLPPGPEI
jgi:hypothetical protein